ncbi:MAG TPA: hemolysin family protein [Mycobacteriales bacterium]|nr:hemolysin family protein [Mycobacteriales bacterium]
MSAVLLDAAIVLFMILVEAVFVASEIALISLRESQVAALATAGRRGAAVARLVADPNRFLATVQIGVTLTALLSSAYGAVTLSTAAQRALVRLGVPDGPADVLGVIGVTLVISFITLVIGELAPKRLALQRVESTARLVGQPLDRMATLVRPVIWLLSHTTNLLVRMLGGDPRTNRQTITEQELRDLVAAHESLSTDERILIDDVFAASEREVREVMVPRTEVEFLESTTTISRAVRAAMTSRRSRYPVVGRNQDDVVGFVHVRDLLDPQLPGGRAARVADVTREVTRLPGSKKVLAALSEMRREGHHLAIVVDEYGGTDGIVTLEDLIEEVIGDIRDEYDLPTADGQRLATGEMDVDGLHNLDDFAESTGIKLPVGPYETAAGFVMSALGRLPTVGDTVEADGRRIEVAEMDGRRVARLRISPPATAAAGRPGPYPPPQSPPQPVPQPQMPHDTPAGQPREPERVPGPPDPGA